MTTTVWPREILPPGTISRRIVARTLGGTVSLSGFTQRTSIPAHAWVIEYGRIAVGTPEKIRTWDALEAELDGGAVPILVHIVEGERRPLEVYFFTDDTTFTDGTGFVNGGVAVGEVVGAHSAGATVITIRTTAEILPGMHFSIGERLYRVAKVLDVTDDDHECSIRPPLRDAVLDEAAVDFETLRVKCRLATDDEMNLTLQPPSFGFGNVRFVEDPN